MTRISELELAKLVEQLGPSLVLFARQWCTCPDDALQEALIELVRQDPAPRSPKAWLFRSVRHKSMNLARSERRRSHYESSASGTDLWFEPDAGSSMDAALAVQWIERLPDIQRQIVTARIWGELTFEQIADVVDRPTATAYRLFHEALQTMRQQMEPSRSKPNASNLSKENRP